MTVIKSEISFYQNFFDLNWVYSTQYSYSFSDNINQSMGGFFAEDAYTLNSYPGYELTTLLVGSGFKVNNSGMITAGLLNAYVQVYWAGSEPMTLFYIQYTSLSAKTFFGAMSTPSTSDDVALLNSTLRNSDTFILSDYDDNANGLAGNDTMYGYGGNDTLTGGAGQDYLEGGLGNNTFVLNAVSESANLENACDFISDFYHGYDKLDVSSIDASTKMGGNNSFVFKGTTAFGRDKAGEIYYKQFDSVGTSNDYTLVYIDNDSDAASESIIKLAGLVALSASDFYL